MRHKFHWDFEIKTDHLILGRLSLIVNNRKKKKEKKKRTCQLADFTILANHRVKIKESEKRDKYLDLARELKRHWNMTVTVILLVISTLGTILKGLLKVMEDLEIRGQEETIYTTASLRSTQILRRVLET